MTPRQSHPEYDPVGRSAPSVPDLAGEPVPVTVTLSPEDIALMYVVQGYGPNEFNQELLTRFRDAGVPVEGSIMLRLAHGQIYKMRTDTAGLGRFVYMWLPEAYVAGLNAMGGVA